MAAREIQNVLKRDFLASDSVFVLEIAGLFLKPAKIENEAATGHQAEDPHALFQHFTIGKAQELGAEGS